MRMPKQAVAPINLDVRVWRSGKIQSCARLDEDRCGQGRLGLEVGKIAYVPAVQLALVDEAAPGHFCA